MKTMKLISFIVLAATFMVCTYASYAGTIGTEFTYQGRLHSEGNPAEGSYDLKFWLFDDASIGTGKQVGPTIIKENVNLADGYFTVELDFTAESFGADARWLQIGIRPGESIDPNGFVVLSPRQKITAVPFALNSRQGILESGWVISGDTIYSGVSGNIGIGTEHPASKLDIVGDEHISGTVGIGGKVNPVIQLYALSGNNKPYTGYFDNTDNADDAFAIYSLAHGQGGTIHYGVFGGALGANVCYGLYGSASGKGTNYGVYGTAGNGTTANWAGYFDGDVYVRNQLKGTGTIQCVNSTGGGIAVSGLSTNLNGYGVRGEVTNGGYAIYGVADGPEFEAPRIGGYFEATPGKASSIGIIAKGNIAAQFFGPIQVRGNIQVKDQDDATIIELGKGLDYAEGFNVSTRIETGPGSVLVIDPDNPGKLALSVEAYDKKVAGIVAGAKGLGSAVRLGAGQYDHDVALAGRVYCNVDATNEAVRAGDLLTTSSTPGHAMKVADHGKAQGAILGKAMENLEQGKKRQILVLVTLQ
jgi:hypothetical protein